MGSIWHFHRALPASIWGHCSQVLVFTSIWGTQKGVWWWHFSCCFFPAFGYVGTPKHYKTRENAKWQIDPVLPSHLYIPLLLLKARLHDTCHTQGTKRAGCKGPATTTTTMMIVRGRMNRRRQEDKETTTTGTMTMVTTTCRRVRVRDDNDQITYAPRVCLILRRSFQQETWR